MLLPRSPEGAVEINQGCDPRSTRPLTLLSPAHRRGAGHRSHLASSPPRLLPRPCGAQGRGGIPSLAGGYTPGYQPHAPPGRAPSSLELQRFAFV